MKHLPLFTGLLLGMFSGHPLHAEGSINASTQYEQRSGWELLFDGMSTQGWRNYQSQATSKDWMVRDGVLTCTKGAGDLITTKQYENFELSIEYRISKGGNSGVLFHVTEEGKKAWHSGPEVQLLDNANHKAVEKSGWLYQLYKPVVPAWSLRARATAGVDAPREVDATRPAGEWNHLYLRVAVEQCEVVLNGVGYFRFRKGDAQWDELVAKSKFSKFPQFGKSTTGHICLQEHGNEISFRNIKLRQLTPDGQPSRQPIDGTLPLQGKLAFPNLEWEGWEPVDERGRNKPLRIMELTHAGDSRIFVAAQRGLIYCFDNRPNVAEAKLFLDIEDRVADWRRNNEEGLLGLAFHPKFKTNGHFYVYYSSSEQERTSVLSRFTISQQDPGKAEANSEQILMKFEQPFANHNGGSIAFGHDGYLYIGLGDGGDRNDPLGNGQNLATWLGSILRIDVDQHADGNAYGIPGDNPFTNVAGAKPEIYAHGLRNIWRLSVDKKAGDLWAADVGQDLWEEINVIQRGGNYGWSIREGTHLFGNAETGDVGEPIDPIWEYDHRIGASITGGRVYRGRQLPELEGKYIYADYVSGRIWALDYDRKANKVIKNLEIASGGIPVLAFGEDVDGEVYYMTAAPNGQCIFRFERKD